MDKLKELVSKWRSELIGYPTTGYGCAARAAVKLCADELEQALATLEQPPSVRPAKEG